MNKFLSGIKKILICFVIVGALTAGIDYFRMNNGEVPIFNIRYYNLSTKVQTFRGIFYIAQRKVSASEVESLVDSSEIKYRILFFDLNVPKQFQEPKIEYTIETEEIKNCLEPSRLYYADLSIKVYTYCLNDISILQEGQKNSLLFYLQKDITILDDIDSKLSYLGLYKDGTSLMFQTMEDTFTNNGLRMFRCNQVNINDVYIGPYDMSFQNDFCTYKEDDFYFLWDIEEMTSESGSFLQEKEVFFEDEVYRYEFLEVKSDYIYITIPAVRGRGEAKYPLKEILYNHILSIEDLEKKGLVFEKIDKQKELEESLNS